MGYRSQVVLAISKELMPHFLNVMAKVPEARELVFADHVELDQNYLDEGHLFVRWDSIKWYAGDFDGVTAIQKFIDEASCDEFELDDSEEPSSEYFRFVRVGEDPSDIDCNGDGFEHIYPYNSISW